MNPAGRTAERPSPRAPDVGRSSRHARGRVRRPGLIALGVLAILIVLGVLAVLPALSARERMEAGRDLLVEAADRLEAGDLDGAVDAFGDARISFRDARADARSPVLRLVGLVPLVGRTADATVVLAEAGELTSAAGLAIGERIAELPGGIASIAPSRGRLPIEAVELLRPTISAARHRMEEALAGVEALPTSFLLGPVADARDEALDELEPATVAARRAEAIASVLPTLAGAEGDRRYFVAAQASAELRGTGGFMGSWTILEASDGRLSMQPMRSITELRNVPSAKAPQAPQGYDALFGQFGGPGYWRNINMDPDAPTSASLIESLYQQVTGERIDGVVFVDPQTVAELLEATGPVTPPDLNRTLDASGAVDYLANEAYLEFGDQAERKQVLGSAVLAVWTRFMQDAEPVAALRALGDAASGLHLVVHAIDPTVQAGLEEAGVAGSVGTDSGDLLGVFASSASGTKVDYYVRREIRYDVQLEPSGGATGDLDITLVNEAPADAEPNYALGPYPGTDLDVGDSLSYVTATCASGCTLEGATLDGEPSGLEAHTLRGFPVFSEYLRANAADSGSLGLSLAQPSAWEGGDDGGLYRLTLQGQATIQPTTATVTIRAPSGMEIVDTNVPMELSGAEAEWTGTLNREVVLAVRFEQPFPSRLWG